MQQQQRLAAETPEERTARLEYAKAQQQQRLAAETFEERAARLEHMKAQQQQRLATETAEQRVARLEQMKAQQQQRLATETQKERTARLNHLQHNRDARQHDVSLDTHLPLLEQKHVKERMEKFHQEMMSIESPTCLVCMEKFPGMKVNPHTNECLRCSRDKHVPKLYSAENNMHPGTVPPQLQVNTLVL